MIDLFQIRRRYDRSGKVLQQTPPVPEAVWTSLSLRMVELPAFDRSATGSDYRVVNIADGSSTRFTFRRTGELFRSRYGRQTGSDRVHIARRVYFKAANGTGAGELASLTRAVVVASDGGPMLSVARNKLSCFHQDEASGFRSDLRRGTSLPDAKLSADGRYLRIFVQRIQQG